MRNSSSPSLVVDACQPRPSDARPPAHLQRKIDRRWKEWEGWVRLHLLRATPYDAAVASAETVRLRKRHTEHILAMKRQGIAMRLIRKYRLDDPRITDEVRAVLVRTVIERKRKARVKPASDLGELITIAALGLSPRALDITLSNCQGRTESLQTSPRGLLGATDPEGLQLIINSIKKRICAEFHLAEMHDPDLKVPSHRQVFVFPRQLAMYLVKQLTGASLQEIGREFGGIHHTTVLHSINKIEAMRRLDEKTELYDHAIGGRLAAAGIILVACYLVLACQGRRE